MIATKALARLGVDINKINKKTNLGMFVVFQQLNLFCLNFAVAVKLYFVHLLLVKMVGMLKSRGIAWNQFFVSKMLLFHQITIFFFGGGEIVPVIKN